MIALSPRVSVPVDNLRGSYFNNCWKIPSNGMLVNKRYVCGSTPQDEPKEADFQLVTEDVPPLETGEVLCEAMYLSVDPCIRLLNKEGTEGQTVPGTQVAKVVESADERFPVGGLVVGDLGWQLYSVCRPASPHAPHLLPDLGHFPASLALGVLGTPGNVAYCSLLELCQPDVGDVVVVSIAGGAVGSTAAQIAKIKGCTVVGIVGSEEEATWLRDVGLDAVVNHRATSDLAAALREVAPRGVNCYLDNVGGEVSAVVMSQMNLRGRVACCVATCLHDCDHQPAPAAQPHIIDRQLRVEGMMPQRWSERESETYRVLSKWLVEGKLHYRETVFEGFEKLPQAFTSALQGQNVGKVIVRA